MAALAMTAAWPAQAKNHQWRFTEVFSNADGSVQFIEMLVSHPAGTGEWQMTGVSLASDANSYNFPNDLPQENTLNRWMLIATQPFADLPGAPAPDFIIPEQFFDPAGDEIRYRSATDIFTIPAGAMPTNGVQALSIDLGVPMNTPTNFAGDTATVFAVEPIPALPIGGVAFAAALLAALALLVHARRARAVS